MRIAFVVAGKDLRLRLRDRSFLLMAVVAPLLLATIISLAIGSSFNNFRADFAVVNEDGGPVAAAFVDGVLKAPQLARIVTLHTEPSAVAARRATRGSIDVAFVIPAGFSAAVLAGQPAHLEVIRNQTRLISGQLGEALAKTFASRVQAVQLAVRTALASGSQVDPATLAQDAAASPQTDLLRTQPSGGRDLRPAAYFGPAMALFFIFFTVGMGARSLLAERISGTLSRLRAAPIQLNAIVLGKVMATFVMGLASVLTLLLTTSLLLGAQWSHPLAVVALTAAAVLAAMGIVTLVMSLAKTEQQAGAYGSVVALVLALLGGSFVPISFAPATLRKLALLTPNGWALRGYTDLATGATRLTTVFTAIGVCIAVAVVTGGIGLARVARAVEQ